MLIFGNHDENTLEQMRNCAATGERAVLCADGHLGYSQPVGGVVAYKGEISISGVGFDIACGNMAVRLPVLIDSVRERSHDLGREIYRRISFGVGRRNETPVENECLDDDPAWAIPEIAALRDMARAQLGTVGSGNHYVDVFGDTEGWVWVGVHFGSRGLGHKIATHYLKAAGGVDGMMVPPTVVSATSDLGEQYLLGMALAGRYASAGRAWVCREVTRIIMGYDGVWTDHVHNHHNFAWQETHDGVEMFVVRKGATPAFPGQRGFVGGSMGDQSVILRGVDSSRSRDALYSTIHGAGRVMGRREAAGKWRWKKGTRVKVSAGRVDEAAMRQAVAARGIVLVGAGADEAPEVYRRLPDVLAEHEGTVEIEHRMSPLIVVMAGSDEFDPYKD